MQVRFIRTFTFIIAICILTSVSTNAQSNDSYIPNVLPPSPNAAALMKFSDIPVSPYTGTAHVTVPIYTIQAKGLSVPIELDYHTGGIKLKEEASSVGLGWALSAGGSISRTIRDKDDFNTGYPYFTNQVPQLPGDLSSVQYIQASSSNGGAINFGPNMFDMACTYLVNTTGGTEDFFQPFNLEGNNGTAAYDMEPDIFNYNFGGHSGKFILTRAGGVVLQKQDNIQISFEQNGNSFTILDEKGNKFYFAAKETMESATGLPSSQAVSSWDISNIITNQGDSINFTYNSDNTYTQTQPDVNETYSFNCNPSDPHVTGNTAPYLYFNLWLQSISFSSGQLQFVYDGSRSDVLGGKKLDAVKLYSHSKNGLNYIKEHDLYYSYFVPTYYQTWGADSLTQLRLRLDSVKEINGGLSVPPYSFSYFLPSVPYNSLVKTQPDIDHWGYYNGASNNSFLPSETVFDDPPGSVQGQNQTPDELIQYQGANREADNSSSAQNMEMFALNTVRYPAGGKTVFSYQPNDYDDSASTIVSDYGTGVAFPQLQQIQQHIPINIDSYGYTTGTINVVNIFPIIPNGGTGTNLSLDVFFMGTGNTSDTVPNYKNERGRIYFNMTGPGINLMDDISDSYCTGNSENTCTENTTLAIHTGDSVALNYTAYIDPSVSFNNFSEIDVNIFYNNLQNDNTSPTSSYGGFVAGGLRIATVTDYTSDTVVANQRKYIYGYQRTSGGATQNYSYGRLMSRPSYLRYNPGQVVNIQPDGNGYCTDLLEYATSLTPLTSVIQGNIVGYDQVTEMKVNPTTGQDIGKTVYTYFNSPDTGTNYAGFSFPGAFNMGDNLNGSLLSKTTYANVNGSYQSVESEVNYYHTTNRIVYFSPEYKYLGGPVTTSFCNYDTSTPHEVFSCFYPSIKSERVLLDSTIQSLYDQYNPALVNAQTKRLYYDNPIHYLVTRTNMQDSKGRTIVQLMRYPQDYIPSNGTVTGNTNLDAMIGENRVSEVIENQDSLYDPGASSGVVTGAQLQTYRVLPDGYTAADKIFRLDVPGPVTNFQPFSVSGNTVSQDNRYETKISFDRYDLKSDIVQYTPEDQVQVSFIWDYSNTYPIAKVVNSDSTSAAYTSFEADGTGNWVIGTGSVDTTVGITGSCSFNLGGNISKSGLNSATTYIVSYWTENSSYFNIAGTISGYPVQGKSETINGNNWTLYVHKVTGQSTITVSGSGHIDELRLYPSTAQMTTYTYSPLVGMTSQTDVGNRVTYYEYDGLQRLKRIRDQDYNILKTYEYQYQVPAGCNGCQSVAMETFLGTNTLGYPLGVFDIHGNLVGNAAGASAYVSLWNSDTADARVGTLSTGNDSLHFNIVLNAGQTLPASVTGCRYYQYDLPWTRLDGVRNFNGTYVDFGDGTGMHLGNTTTDTPSVIAPNTTYATISDGSYPGGGPTSLYLVHNYPDSNLWTITFYHNDAQESADLDNLISPATSLSKLENFRGNLPLHTTLFGGSSYQQRSATTVANINNWNAITTIQDFFLNSGDQGVTPYTNIAFTQDFMQYNKNLLDIELSHSYYYVNYYDSTFKVSTLKSDWNTYFANLQILLISDDQWNREDLSGLKYLRAVFLSANNQNHSSNPTNNPIIPLPTYVTDSVIIQVGAGAGQNISNGTISISTGGAGRTSASQPAVNALIAKGWSIYIDGILQQSQ